MSLIISLAVSSAQGYQILNGLSNLRIYTAWYNHDMSYDNANPYKVRARKEAEITAKQDKFIKEKIKGHNNKDAAILAGYPAKSASSMGNKLMKNERIYQALEDAGLTDERIADVLNTVITAGLGERATNSDALKGIEMVAKLRGHLKQNQETNSQTNIFIQELTQMSDQSLTDKITELTGEITRLRTA